MPEPMENMGSPGSIGQQQAYLIAFKYHWPGLQVAAGFLGGVEQLPVGEGEAVVMQRTLDQSRFYTGVVERMFAMGTAGFDQVQFTIVLQQQQRQ